MCFAWFPLHGIKTMESDQWIVQTKNNSDTPARFYFFFLWVWSLGCGWLQNVTTAAPSPVSREGKSWPSSRTPGGGSTGAGLCWWFDVWQCRHVHHLFYSFRRRPLTLLAMSHLRIYWDTLLWIVIMQIMGQWAQAHRTLSLWSSQYLVSIVH